MSKGSYLVDFYKLKEEMEVDDETLKELYEIFRDELIQQRGYMKVQIEEENIEELKKTMHNLKSLSGNCRANELFELSSAVYDDLRIKGKEYDELNQMINKIEKLIDETINEVNRFLT